MTKEEIEQIGKKYWRDANVRTITEAILIKVAHEAYSAGLGAAVSATPQPRCLTDEEMREIGRKIGSAVNPESEAVRLLGFFAAAPAQEPRLMKMIDEARDPLSSLHYLGLLLREFAQEQPVEKSPQEKK